MAEPFGIAVGAVSLATLFTSCIECFDYIQLARNFDRDFQTNLLLLECTKLRLSRWGEAINIYNDPDFDKVSDYSEDVKLAKSSLMQILALLEESKRIARKYERSTEPSQKHILDPRVSQSGDKAPLVERLRVITKSRQKRTGVVKKATWAVHDATQLRSLVENAAQLIGNIERLFPLPKLEELATSEVAIVQEHEELELLREPTEFVDPLLQSHIQQAIAGHEYCNTVIGDGARGLLGDYIADDWQGEAVGNSHTYQTVQVFGSARVMMGNKFGGKDPLDD